MSLILEALRKSEAERRRGQVPDLHAEPSPALVQVRDGPPAWLWLALALATAVVLAVALWLTRSVLPMPPDAGEVPVATTVAVGVMPGDSSGNAGAADKPVGGMQPSAIPDTSAGAAPIAVSPPTSAGEDRAPMPASPPAAATQSLPPARAPATTLAVAAPAPVASPAPAAAPRSPPMPMAAVTQPSAVPAAAASTDESAALVAAASGSAPLRLSDLAAAERRQLPPLKMSMHMWAPTQRFAIIDGARVAEGDRIGDAVVAEITADGVVLAWKGQRLKIPTR